MRVNPNKSVYHQRSHQARTVIDGAPEKVPDIAVWGIDMIFGHGDQADFQDVSGFAPYSPDQLLAVRDTKPWHLATSHFGLVDKQTGEYESLDMDFESTGTPYDLEAISATNEKGHFLAVEGGRLLGSTRKLYEVEINDDGGKTTASHDVPSFGQEIESMTVLPSDGPEQTVLFGTRGDEQASQIYWATLNEDGLRFSESGLKGLSVTAPSGLGTGQRTLTEIAIDPQGGVWGASVANAGEGLGSYRSAVFSLGHLSEDDEQPLVIEPGDSYFFDGTKIEAMAWQGNELFLGSDNESCKGRMDLLAFNS